MALRGSEDVDGDLLRGWFCDGRGIKWWILEGAGWVERYGEGLSVSIAAIASA